jgi:hypothetical protein
MAIIKEFYMTRSDGVNLYRSYSDLGLQIHKIGTEEVYDEAIDIENSGFEYEETEIPIEKITDSEFLESV